MIFHLNLRPNWATDGLQLIENDTLGISYVFFLVDILRVLTRSDYETCRALSEQKCRRVGSAQWISAIYRTRKSTK